MATVTAATYGFEGVTLPFTVSDMVGTSINFLTLYGQWVLLALGVIFAPALYGLLLKLMAELRARNKTKR